MSHLDNAHINNANINSLMILVIYFIPIGFNFGSIVCIHIHSLFYINIDHDIFRLNFNKFCAYHFKRLTVLSTK